MAALQVGTADRRLGFRVDVDEVARYASVFAVGGGVLAGAGILSVVAYLSAWNVPAPLVRLDPLTATLRSELVIYQVVLLALIAVGFDAGAQRLLSRPRLRLALGAAVLVILGVLAVDAIDSGFAGSVITFAGAPAIALSHRRGWTGQRGTTALFAVIALTAAFATGADSGRLIRDEPALQTALTLTSRVPVGGLPGGVEEGGAWHYDDLYLVFRDGEAVYVSRPGAGTAVWIIPAMHVMSLGLETTSR
jgi:hypothetical protein